MATNLFSKAAAYRKKHKGLTMPEAVKAVAKGAKVTGTKKKKTVGKLKAVKNVKHCVNVSGIKKNAPKHKKSKHPKLDQILKLTNEIEVLEKYRATYTGTGWAIKSIRDAYQLEINKMHDKLNALKKNY